MFNEAVDDCLAALKFVLDWFVTSKIIKKLRTALYADENIHNFNEYFSNAAFSCNEMGIIDIYLNNINLDDSNYDKDDSKTIIHIRHLAWHINFKKRKAHKKYNHGINANSVAS